MRTNLKQSGPVRSEFYTFSPVRSVWSGPKIIHYHFMPPEALLVRPHYDKPIDVFSLACVALHVMSHQWPEPEDLVQELRNNNGLYETREVL